MKTRLSGLLTILLPAVLPVGCARDDASEHIRGPQDKDGDIRFEIGFAPATRVSTGADFRSVWEDGDEIGIFAVKHAPETTADLQSSGNFIHNVKLTYNSDNGGTWSGPAYWHNDGDVLDFYAYYPYDGKGGNPEDIDPTAIAFAVDADQNGTTGGRSNYNISDLLTASGKDYSKNTKVSLTFSHVLALAQLTLDDTDGVLDLTKDIVVKLEGAKTGTSVNLATDTTTGASGDAGSVTMYRVEQPGDGNYETSFTYRALVPEQNIADGVRIFSIENGDLAINSKALDSALGLTSGEAKQFSMTIPLSEVMKQPEANSYMVLPNSRAILIPVSHANTAADPDRNLDANAEGLGDVTADNFEVELVWADMPVGETGVLKEIRAVKHNGEGYVYVRPGIAGNAVVCIKDIMSGNVKWSWHIWVTEPVDSGTDNTTGITWMDRNLGAKSNTPILDGSFDQAQWAKTFGLYYQWGRKDAFPGATENLNNQTYYIGSSTTGTTATLPSGSYTELPDLVQNPLNFAVNNSYSGSLTERSRSNKSWIGNNGEKTIYDPCPHGWMVPPLQVGNLYSWGNGIILVDDDTWTFKDYAGTYKGALFKRVNGTEPGHFYPMASHRNCDNGKVISLNQGFCWSASTILNGKGRNLLIAEDQVDPQKPLARSFGLSVRCIAE